HTALSIDAGRHSVLLRDLSGTEQWMSYDRLVIATGAESRAPKLQGLGLPGVFPLRWVPDSIAVREFIEQYKPERAVIVGGGYIGLEMVDAFLLRGLAVTIVDHNPTLLKTVEAPLGERIAEELTGHGVKVVTQADVQRIERHGAGLHVVGRGVSLEADLVLVGVGVAPSVDLAIAAGIETGVRGAIRVNRLMETNLPNIYAAGDCVETWHRILQRPTYLPLGTTAHKQGRVAGENAVTEGEPRLFEGSLGTQVVQILGLVVTRTGLLTEEARQAGCDPLTVGYATWDHKVYYPGATTMQIRLTADRHTGKLLGGQILGRRGAEISKRVDILATALFHGMSVEALNDLDLSYTPPLSSP
ncbi:MAG: FAD-dependent oxidoreductase, partial [Chloroflexi bacterium]|nr:FAD-dependent oxidoreductase [Chloroflexota bacterium]